MATRAWIELLLLKDYLNSNDNVAGTKITQADVDKGNLYHTHWNYDILNKIIDAGSGKIITDIERDELKRLASSTNLLRYSYLYGNYNLNGNFSMFGSTLIFNKTDNENKIFVDGDIHAFKALIMFNKNTPDTVFYNTVDNITDDIDNWTAVLKNPLSLNEQKLIRRHASQSIICNWFKSLLLLFHFQFLLQ